MDSRKRLLLTEVVFLLLSILTGYFAGGGLIPSRIPQEFTVTTSNMTFQRTFVSLSDFAQRENTVTTTLKFKETSPHGYSHGYAANMIESVNPRDALESVSQAPNEIRATERDFVPSMLTVPVGTTVIWVSRSGESHTVTSTTGLFDTALEPGDIFKYTFTEAGIYDYFCIPHSGMAGSIVVK